MNKLERFIITGGSGFIGSHFIRYLIHKNDKFEIFNLDCLTYAADNRRLADISKKKYHFIKIDIREKKRLKKTIDKINPTAVFHFAAETHVDNSIRDPSNFISTNIEGTYNLLESIKNRDTRLVHISTDEIYGDRTTKKSPYFTEESNYSPSSPYSASKASQEMLIKAYIRTYGLNAIILRPCNNYGPFQHREKFVPTCIINAIRNKSVPIYGDGKNMREWIFVRDTVQAIYSAFENFQAGAIFNIGSGKIISNLDMARLILKLTRRDQSLIRFVDDRPGHDTAYGIESRKIKRLGFKPQVSLIDGLKKTIDWFEANINIY